MFFFLVLFDDPNICFSNTNHCNMPFGDVFQSVSEKVQLIINEKELLLLPIRWWLNNYCLQRHQLCVFINVIRIWFVLDIWVCTLLLWNPQELIVDLILSFLVMPKDEGGPNIVHILGSAYVLLAQLWSAIWYHFCSCCIMDRTWSNWMSCIYVDDSIFYLYMFFFSFCILFLMFIFSKFKIRWLRTLW